VFAELPLLERYVAHAHGGDEIEKVEFCPRRKRRAVEWPAAHRATDQLLLLVLTGLADGDDTALWILLRFKVSHLYLRLFGFGFRWHLITSFRLRAACDEISARSQGGWMA